MDLVRSTVGVGVSKGSIEIEVDSKEDIVSVLDDNEVIEWGVKDSLLVNMEEPDDDVMLRESDWL